MTSNKNGGGGVVLCCDGSKNLTISSNNAQGNLDASSENVVN